NASLDTGLALVGRGFEGSREDLIRFGDELQSVFGEGLDDALSKIYATFFSSDELAQVTSDIARSSAAALLEGIGIEFSDQLATTEGFRALWDELFLTLGPDAQAVLIEAGLHVADLIAAEECLSKSREAEADKLAKLMDQVDDAFLGAVAPASASLKRLVDRWTDLEEQAIELGASEGQLMRVRRAASAEMSRWISDMTLSTLRLAEDFFSVERSFSNVGRAISTTVNNMR